jgi:membrane-associated phospholipid phosphatase
VAEGLLRFLARDLRRDLTATRAGPDLAGGGLWLVHWSLMCLLIGATLFVSCGYHAGFVRLNGFAAGLPGGLWQSVTALGDERVAFAVSLFFARRYPQVFWSLVVAALIATLYTHSLKPLVGALRPPAVLPPGAFNLLGPALRHESFPSGHSTTIAVLCGVWICFVRAGWGRAALVLLAVAVGFSRVAVGVHWPMDVAAGLAGGTLAAWAGVAIAARTPGGARSLAVHLAVVLIAAAFAASLLVSDKGYHAAAGFQQLIGAAALLAGLSFYVLLPALRRRREVSTETG